MKENSLILNKHILLCLDGETNTISTELYYLKKNFCGIVLSTIEVVIVTDQYI
jgi:hypothetical protein